MKVAVTHDTHFLG